MRAAASIVVALALTACAGGSRLDAPRREFLGQAAVPSEIIATELAFARLARDKGTWTAFRETATDDAVWPNPGWVNVKSDLKGAPDPAQAIVWEPDAVTVSCDGSFALSTGPATYSSGKRTRFATIWQRQDDGRYKWVVDQGFDLEAGYQKDEMISAGVAECGARRSGRPSQARRGLAWQSAQSDDGTLAWTSELRPDCGRTFTVRVRKAGVMEEVFRRDSAPSTAPSTGTPPRCAA